MSTEPASRRARAQRRRGRSYALSFGIVVVALGLVGAAAGLVGVAQGPRVTAVQFDADAAVASSGSRLILTTSQSLAEIDPSQVSITPRTEVQVETSGRSVGLRFALPLRDDTAYTVSIDGVRAVGGSATAALVETFRTPPLHVYLLQRGDEEDTVFRTDLAGESALPVFTHPHIEDFRATRQHLVMSVRDESGAPQLIVTGPEGGGARTLPLPGEGTVQDLQTAERGEIVGYTYTDADMSAPDARASVLYTASLREADADSPPARLEVAGEPVSVAQWRFVPDTDSLLLLTFEGRLLLTAADAGTPVDLGAAAELQGIARGSSTAVVLRADGLFDVDLTDGSETPLVAAAGVSGYPGGIVPLGGGATLRQYTDAGPEGGTTLFRVDADAASAPVFAVQGTAALLQTCVSPSGRYAAVLVQPDAVDNPYDTSYALPVPLRVETRIIDLEQSDPAANEVSNLGAFDISWCQVPLR